MADQHNNLASTFIDIGRMRQRVSLMQPSDAADSSGKPLPGTVFAERWASVEPSSGLALEIAKQYTTETAYTVVMHWFAGVDPKMTLTMGERSFQILAAPNARERKVKLVLLCREYL